MATLQAVNGALASGDPTSAAVLLRLFIAAAVPDEGESWGGTRLETVDELACSILRNLEKYSRSVSHSGQAVGGPQVKQNFKKLYKLDVYFARCDSTGVGRVTGLERRLKADWALAWDWESDATHPSLAEFLWLCLAALCKHCRSDLFQQDLLTKSEWLCHNGGVEAPDLQEALWSIHLLETLLLCISRNAATFSEDAISEMTTADVNLPSSDATNRSLLADSRRFIASTCQFLSVAPLLTSPAQKVLTSLFETSNPLFKGTNSMYHIKCRQASATVIGNLILLDVSPCTKQAAVLSNPFRDPSSLPTPSTRGSINCTEEASDLALTFLHGIAASSTGTFCRIDEVRERFQEVQRFADDLLVFLSTVSTPVAKDGRASKALEALRPSAAQPLFRLHPPRTETLATSFLTFAEKSVRKLEEKANRAIQAPCCTLISLFLASFDHGDCRAQSFHQLIRCHQNSEKLSAVLSLVASEVRHYSALSSRLSRKREAPNAWVTACVGILGMDLLLNSMSKEIWMAISQVIELWLERGCFSPEHLNDSTADVRKDLALPFLGSLASTTALCLLLGPEAELLSQLLLDLSSSWPKQLSRDVSPHSRSSALFAAEGFSLFVSLISRELVLLGPLISRLRRPWSGCEMGGTCADLLVAKANLSLYGQHKARLAKWHDTLAIIMVGSIEFQETFMVKFYHHLEMTLSRPKDAQKPLLVPVKPLQQTNAGATFNCASPPEYALQSLARPENEGLSHINLSHMHKIQFLTSCMEVFPPNIWARDDFIPRMWPILKVLARVSNPREAVSTLQSEVESSDNQVDKLLVQLKILVALAVHRLVERMFTLQTPGRFLIAEEFIAVGILNLASPHFENCDSLRISIVTAVRGSWEASREDLVEGAWLGLLTAIERAASQGDEEQDVFDRLWATTFECAQFVDCRIFHKGSIKLQRIFDAKPEWRDLFASQIFQCFSCTARAAVLTWVVSEYPFLASQRPGRASSRLFGHSRL